MKSTAAVEASKVKVENLDVVGERCWRGSWQSALNITGEISNGNIKVRESVILNFRFERQNRIISQKLGSCLSSSFLLRWPTQSWPWCSTTMMADVFVCKISDDINISSRLGQQQFKKDSH